MYDDVREWYCAGDLTDDELDTCVAWEWVTADEAATIRAECPRDAPAPEPAPA